MRTEGGVLQAQAAAIVPGSDRVEEGERRAGRDADRDEGETGEAGEDGEKPVHASLCWGTPPCDGARAAD